MREISNNNMETVKDRIKRLQGLQLKLLINRGRNRFTTVEGVIDKMYPNVFTIKADDGDTDILTFSYSDVMTKNIRFYPKTKN